MFNNKIKLLKMQKCEFENLISKILKLDTHRRSTVSHFLTSHYFHFLPPYLFYSFSLLSVVFIIFIALLINCHQSSSSSLSPSFALSSFLYCCISSSFLLFLYSPFLFFKFYSSFLFSSSLFPLHLNINFSPM